MTPSRLTLDDYRARLQEGDRWIELVDGVLQRHDPPDELHGNIVRNLSRTLGRVAKTGTRLYACYELGLVIDLQSPTIFAPAISCFTPEQGFGPMDDLLTTEKPALVIEIASSPLRREGMSARIKRYQDAGIGTLWVLDPVTRHLHQFANGRKPRMTRETETFRGDPLIPELEKPLIDLFADPEWLRSGGTH